MSDYITTVIDYPVNITVNKAGVQGPPGIAGTGGGGIITGNFLTSGQADLRYYQLTNPQKYSTSGDLYNTGHILYNYIIQSSGNNGFLLTLSGNLTQTGILLTNSINSLSGFTLNNLYLTGNNLYHFISGVSGNLGQTGILLENQINALSGFFQNQINHISGGNSGITNLPPGIIYTTGNQNITGNKTFTNSLIIDGGAGERAFFSQKNNTEFVWGLNVDSNNGDAMDVPLDSAFKFGMMTTNINGGGDGYNGIHLQAQPSNVGTWTNAPTIFTIDVNGNMSIAGNIQDSSKNISVDINNRVLSDGGGNSIYWGSRKLLDGVSNYSVDWSDRKLVDVAQNRILDWNNYWLIDVSGNNSLDWENRILSGNWNIQSLYSGNVNIGTLFYPSNNISGYLNSLSGLSTGYVLGVSGYLLNKINSISSGGVGFTGLGLPNYITRFNNNGSGLSTGSMYYDSNGNILFSIGGTYTIGAFNGSNNPASLWLTGPVTASSLQFNNMGAIFPTSDGVIEITNVGANGFGRLMFGGTSNSFPAIKRSGANFALRVADDTDFTNLLVKNINATGNIYSSGNIYSNGNLLLNINDSGFLQNEINIINNITGNFYTNNNLSGYLSSLSGLSILYVTGISGSLQIQINSSATITNLYQTGSNLFNDIISLSGQASNTYSTINNLYLTGHNLYADITGLSGQANINYATNTNLYLTGNKLSAIQVTGSSIINNVNITGFNGINVFYSGGFVCITGSSNNGSSITNPSWLTLTCNPVTIWNAAANVIEDKRILTLTGNSVLNITGLYNGWCGVLKNVQGGNSITGFTLGLNAFTNTNTSVVPIIINSGNGMLNLTYNSGSVDVIGFEYDGLNLLTAVGNNFT